VGGIVVEADEPGYYQRVASEGNREAHYRGGYVRGVAVREGLVKTSLRCTPTLYTHILTQRATLRVTLDRNCTHMHALHPVMFSQAHTWGRRSCILWR
jgi:hypothetical protein